jgi:cell cycle checkpoint protein
MDNEGKKKKKKRKVRFSPPSRLTWGGGGNVDASRKPARESTLWVDKYAPKNTADLCVASKKVEEVRCWMETRSPSEKMLILIGSPGVGKSTLVRLLAKELDWTVHEWSDSYSNKSDSLGPMSVEQISPLRSFEEFLQRTGAGFRPLLRSESRASKAKSIILLDELPNLYSSEAETNFR